MKVIHFGKFYPPHRGGMEKFLEMLCQGLVRRGVQCEVIVARDPGDPEEKCHDGVPIRRMRSLGTLNSLSICPEALGVLRGVQADIFHLHHPNPLADISYLLSKPKGRLVVTYHSDIINKQWISCLYAPLLNQILDRTEVIVATSPQYVLSSSVLARYQTKTRIIPLGCDPFVYDYVKPINLQKDVEPQYLFVGRLVPYKGISVLLEALRQAPGRLWIAGTGPLTATIKKEIAIASLSDRVELLGDISEEEKLQRLAACDAMVLPSLTRAEAFGIVLLEAMAMGRPVVVSDLPTGVRMIVDDGVNGYRFPPGDAQALAAIFHKLAAEPAIAKKMGDNGRRILQERFTADLMVDRYLRLYQDLCAA